MTADISLERIFKDQAEAAYLPALVERLLQNHKLGAATTVDALRTFLIDAGRVYLIQKNDQEVHQSPSLLRKELLAINKLASKLSDKLDHLLAHVHDFEQSRLLQKVPFGGLGPVSPCAVPGIERRYQKGEPEYELARCLDVVCRDTNVSGVQGIMVFSKRAAEVINAKGFGGRLPDLALNRWADNVRNFWVKGMRLEFPHSVVGKNATSAPANFCIDSMALLDNTVTKAGILTAVRYARDSAIAWEKLKTDNQTETAPDPDGLFLH